ncbi:hypothetical protein L085_01860 [Serratia sp. FS14]|uniref:hypothetical protein n=1 Tax=Serratia sp. (strain FS14) TaxID=1327989 RepID=UPI000499494C|nr:hypothetical protein [Serratia sp. FS14]AIA45836.1 hypothetical protein L085_01860 [Serratia sp. FS14]
MLILVVVIIDLLRELMVGVDFIYNMLFKGWNNMSTIRSLDFDEMKLIGGCGDGNNGGDRDRPSRGASNSCANQVGMGIIIGAFTGFSGDPPGMIDMTVAGGLMGAVSCADNSPAGNNKNNGGALGGNKNANSANGQCRW